MLIALEQPFQGQCAVVLFVPHGVDFGLLLGQTILQFGAELKAMSRKEKLDFANGLRSIFLSEPRSERRLRGRCGRGLRPRTGTPAAPRAVRLFRPL